MPDQVGHDDEVGCKMPDHVGHDENRHCRLVLPVIAGPDRQSLPCGSMRCPITSGMTKTVIAILFSPSLPALTGNPAANIPQYFKI